MAQIKEARFTGVLISPSTPMAFRCTGEGQHMTDVGDAATQLARIRVEMEVRDGRVDGQVAVVGGRLALVELRALTTRIVQQQVDLCAFQRCTAAYVSLHHWRHLDGETTFVDEIPELADSTPPGTTELLSEAIAHPKFGPWLGTALGDLRAAVVDRDRTPMHCARAVESVRQAFVGDNSKEKTKLSWKRMHEALDGIAEEDLRVITDASQHSRHGGMTYFSGEARLDLIRRARETVLAFARHATN